MMKMGVSRKSIGVKEKGNGLILLKGMKRMINQLLLDWKQQ